MKMLHAHSHGAKSHRSGLDRIRPIHLRVRRDRLTAERGSTLALAAAAMVLLLGMGALAIDVVTLYVARTEAQRAADAAAIAGATVFVNSGCTGSGSCSDFQDQARNQVKAVGDQNEVFGQLANVADADITFPPSPDANDPLLQVIVHRNVPTLLAGALRRLAGGTASHLAVAATATAEAFNPSLPGPTAIVPPFADTGLKPWIFPNSAPGKPMINAGVVDPTVIGQPILASRGRGHKHGRHRSIYRYQTLDLGGDYADNITGSNSTPVICNDPNGLPSLLPAVNPTDRECRQSSDSLSRTRRH
jgi:hypothetical protein